MDYLIIAIFGAIWGSFANVCIYRLPDEKGVISGRSQCQNCNKKIVWFDNIPIISYLLLKGKCRSCHKRIEIQYIFVELISITFFILIYFYYGISLTTLFLIVLFLSFLIIFFIDLKHFIIPDILTFPTMLIGFLKSFDPNLNDIFPNYINSLIGGFLGYLIIWSIIFLYKKVRKKEGMGLGDAKLLAVVGFWFGWISIPFVIFISSVLALIIVIPDLIRKSKELGSQIPFGPYIIIGTVVFIILKEHLLKLLL